MNIDKFQKFLDRIDPGLNKDEKRDKMVQMADFSHFADCYSSKLSLLDCIQYEINIVDYDGIKAGILFCDLSKLKKGSFHPSLYTPFSSDFFREQMDIEEFWFVFVEESLNAHLKKFTDFIKQHKLSDLYNRIFLFSFFESTIRRLK